MVDSTTGSEDAQTQDVAEQDIMGPSSRSEAEDQVCLGCGNHQVTLCSYPCKEAHDMAVKNHTLDEDDAVRSQRSSR